MESYKFVCTVLFISVTLFHTLKETSGASTGDNFKEHIVFTYSTVNATGDGPARITQLTIATGPDGKLHYVQNENGNKTTGIWDGPLPSTPDADKIAQKIQASNEKLVSKLSKLSTEIDASIEQYLNKAFEF